MQKPYQPPHPEHDMICPNCGSHNVTIDESTEVKNTHNESLKQYLCGDCESHFIPTVTESIHEDSITKPWVNKMRTQEGMNEGKSWSKPKIEYIIISKKKK